MEQSKTDDQFYVLATHSLTEEQTFTLKHNDTFAIFNKYGDIPAFNKSTYGIFHKGTRFLSDFRFSMEGRKPLYLSSDVKEGNEMLTVDLTNPDIKSGDALQLEKGLVHIMRKKVLWDGILYEQVLFSNFGLSSIDFDLGFSFDADFSDIFEVRGTERARKGTKHPPANEGNRIILKYTGLDNVERLTDIRLNPGPDEIKGTKVSYHVKLAPDQSFMVSITIIAVIGGDEQREVPGFQAALKKHKRRLDFINQSSVKIFTSNEQFNHWMDRSKADLITMITDTPAGPFPYAGIPWYNTPFGRDALITAFECLWSSPEVSAGVLRFLARTQAAIEDPFRDAEPGKILHEARKGEMANLNEIPFKHYYGSIDSTPLFIVLAGAYLNRTGDMGVINEIWPNIELALSWIEKYGDTDGDMFVEYARKKNSGLFNQGWKDSHDAISHSDGSIPEPPIALCEVQGYVYDAWTRAADLSDAMGLRDKAEGLRKKAGLLQQKFIKEFWSEDKSTFYIALDGDKKPCNIMASNPGQCLFSGIATAEQAKMVAGGLLSKNMFTGWGIRTLSSEEVRYNPMSYHNGSVWPHDNALIAYGLSQYGLKEEVKKIASALFDASLFIEGQRLPELFCGFLRRPGEGPTAYPVACSPQAWSVASAFMIIQALLGMEINEREGIIRFYKPVLPDFMHMMEIKNIRFGNGTLDFEFLKTGGIVKIGLMKNDTPARVEIIY